MKTTALLFALPFAFSAASVLAQSTAPPAADGSWKKQQLIDNFWAEGATVLDADKDGKMDVIYGPYWFAGPDFTKRHLIYPDTTRTKAKKEDGTEVEIEGFHGAKSVTNGYSDNFLNAAHDINGDGWTDYIVMGFPGKETLWYENPQGKDGLWTRHVAFDVTDNESPMFADIDGDGRPDLLCMSGGHLGYATFDAAHPSDKWTWHMISPSLAFQRFTHGIGFGDVNGDGRTDILEAKGWWEQPATLDGKGPWTKHEAAFGSGGAQMYVLDVNKDGRPDVITSLAAHGYGLAWLEQTADGWKQHLITGTPTEKGDTGIVFSQPHAIELADMNGDGITDIVTGKRFWAHGKGGDPEPNAPAVVWWFELKRDGAAATFVPHLIDNDSGVGTQFAVSDLNKDGKPDVVVGNKRGAFVHLQQ
ncbi:MAG: FG-GAP repeat domain-containing protein [Verrucomicrobiales bacterium]|nr:VCBS repeat-containing protein [Verrucomicrobiae bacterium]